jgi:hypothetical protein
MNGDGARPNRRAMIALACGGAISLAATAHAATPAKPVAKPPPPPGMKIPKPVSPKRAKYQDHPKQIFSCATCSFFETPDKCKVVIGAVSPNGWCDLYNQVD